MITLIGHGAPFMDFQFSTPEELARELGSRLRSLRISRGHDQAELAARAGVAIRTLRALEQGTGSTTETLLRVLKALEALGGLAALAPTPTISPLALLKRPTPPRRVRKAKGASR